MISAIGRDVKKTANQTPISPRKSIKGLGEYLFGLRPIDVRR
jgi:hypothetical protein